MPIPVKEKPYWGKIRSFRDFRVEITQLLRGVTASDIFPLDCPMSHLRMVSAFSKCWVLQTFDTSVPNPFWQSFFTGDSSHEGVLSALAFESQVLLRLQEFTLCEWNLAEGCQQSCLAVFQHEFPSFGLQCRREPAQGKTQWRVEQKVLTQTETVNSTKQRSKSSRSHSQL